MDTSGHVATPGRRLCDWRARLILGGGRGLFKVVWLPGRGVGDAGSGAAAGGGIHVPREIRRKSNAT